MARHFQLSLRRIIGTLTIVCILLALLALKRQYHYRELSAFSVTGVDVQWQYTGPSWAPQVVQSCSLFHHATIVSLNSECRRDDFLRLLSCAREVRMLSIESSHLTDIDLAGLNGLTNLQVLEVSGEQLSIAIVKHVNEMPQLRELVLTAFDISSNDFDAICKLPYVKTIAFHDCRISEDGLVRFIESHLLDSVDVRWSNVTDRTLSHIAKLRPDLQVLY